MKKTIILGTMVFLAGVATCAAGAEIVTPTAAVASTEYVAAVGSGHLIDPTRLNGSNQHIPKPWGGNWLAADRWNTENHWVYVDLGASFELDELRIWNYHEDGGPGIPELVGRGVKACSIWVAPEGAALPKAGQVADDFTAANGWSQVWAGELNPGPSTLAPVSPVGPTNVFEVADHTGIRYVAIDIDSRWGPDAYTTRSAGLSHIQVTGKSLTANSPAPSNSRQAVAIDSVLSWKPPSAYVSSAYEIYLSSNRQMVAAGDPSVRVTDADVDGDRRNTQYVAVSALANTTDYFWRVDSIVDGKTVPGHTWSFRTELRTENLGFQEIVFVKRKPYSSDHNYSVVNNGTSADRFLPENGIYVYNLRTSETRRVITAADLPGGMGVIGKLSLSFDAKKVIFDYRRDTASGFRIWEVNLDGTRLRQLSFPPADETEKVGRYGRPNFHTDDMHPNYLPDGGIVFTSSRCEHGILCFTQPEVVSVVLHRMDADGGNITQLTQSPVSEFSPVVLDDGRIMYHRWEYIDKGARVGKTFWAMNPDGSKSEELFGLSDSEYATGAFMYPQPVPGDNAMIVCAVGPHFPQGNSVGPIKLIDLSKDNRTSDPLTNLTPEVEIAPSQGGWIFAGSNFEVVSGDGVGVPLYTHPFPVSASQFLVSHKENELVHYMTNGAYAIHMIDTAGNKVLIYEDEDGTVSCWHPTPVRVRRVPDEIYSSRLTALQEKDQALCVVTNVYEGMEGLEHGSVKYLRINEAVPQYWDTKRFWTPNYHSAQWPAALWPRVQWGIVPVEQDGSAYFIVPADRNIFFQALDENYMEVQRERTYVNYRPGEMRTCIGCHERLGKTPRPAFNTNPLALRRPPSIPGPQPGEADPRQVIHYPADIQPIFDAKCVSCHDDSEPDGDLNLTGTITPLHNVSYEQILHRELAGPVIAEFITHTGEDAANINGAYLPPRSLGSHTSGLISKIRTSDPKDPHYQLLSQADRLKIIRWVDANYQFYGTYYGRHHGAHESHPDFRRDPTFEETVSRRAPDWHR